MSNDTLDQLKIFFKKNTIARGVSATIDEINEAEEILNLQFNKDYKIFLLNFGGSIVGRREVC